MRILLAEDDGVISMGLAYALRQEGYEVKVCCDGKSAAAEIEKGGWDLYLLDITLPYIDGYDLCRAVRRAGDTPVLFLTARDDEGSAVLGLDIGADDYITKPFRLREVQSRIRRSLRRSSKTAADQVWLGGGVMVDTARARVMKNGEEVSLTALEYKLLLALLSAKGRVVTRESILENIWDVQGNFVNDNTLTVYMKRLREKLEEDPAHPSLIKTVRGLGYILEEESHA